MHQDQLAEIYAHARKLRDPVHQLKAKDHRTKVLSPRAALEAVTSRDEQALVALGRVPLGMAPWLLYRRRCSTSTS
jgi:hypothetical protein